MKLDNLRDLFIHQLQDMYSAETQSVEILPKMAEKINDKDLKRKFEEHLKETHGHVKKMEKVFEILGEKPEGHKCKAMAGIIAEIKDMLETNAPAKVMDAALITGEQRIEHYEITGYGSVVEFADELEEMEVKDLLKQILEDEKNSDEGLTKSAESGVNERAEEK